MNNTSMYIYELILQYNGNFNAHVRTSNINSCGLAMYACIARGEVQVMASRIIPKHLWGIVHQTCASLLAFECVAMSLQ